MTNIEEKIKKLVDDINQWNKEYFEDNNPSVSDRVYDTHLRELVELEKKYPKFILENSPTQFVGVLSLKNKFKKVEHKKKMLSLDKAYSIEEIQKFITSIEKNVNSNFSFALEPKIDGLSISLIYENGILNKAITRGDGQIGEDVTSNVFGIIEDIPTKINYLNRIEIRGEIYIKKTIFEQINEISEQKYANPRNLASGTLRQLDNQIVKQRKLSSFLYEIVDPELHNLHKQNDVINFLKSNNFQVMENITFTNDIQEIEAYIKNFEQIKTKLNYDVDGIVIKLNEIEFYEKIGYTTKFPKYSIAYKFDDEVVETQLEDIFITIGRTGVVTYNAKLKPILLKGTTVSAATLHNYNYVSDLKLNLGDNVLIKKAGEIIPKVISVAKKNSENTFKKITICPSCKNELIDTDSGSLQICINENCEEINIKKIIHFAARNSMDIEGLGEGIVRKFFKLNILKKIEDIYTLWEHKEVIINEKGFGEKFWSNLSNGIDKSKNITLDKLIFSLGIAHLGARNAKIIANKINKFENILNFDIDSLQSIHDIGPITIKELKIFLEKENNINLIKYLISIGINPTIKSNQTFDENNYFNNKKFVITGTFKIPRKQIEEIIENNGGKAMSSISQNVDIVLCGENSGSKKEKAIKLNIKIVYEEELMKIIDSFNYAKIK